MKHSLPPFQILPEYRKRISHFVNVSIMHCTQCTAARRRAPLDEFRAKTLNFPPSTDATLRLVLLATSYCLSLPHMTNRAVIFLLWLEIPPLCGVMSNGLSYVIGPFITFWNSWTSGSVWNNKPPFPLPAPWFKVFNNELQGENIKVSK